MMGLPGDATRTGDEAISACGSGNGNACGGTGGGDPDRQVVEGGGDPDCQVVEGGGDPDCQVVEGDRRNVGNLCRIGWICNGVVESCMGYRLGRFEPGGFIFGGDGIRGGLLVGSVPASCAGDEGLGRDSGSCDWLLSREDEAGRFPEHSNTNEEDTVGKFRGCVLSSDPRGIFFCAGIAADLSACCSSSSKIPFEAFVTSASPAALPRLASFRHWQHQAGSTFLGSNS